ncbi:hypothetical protein O7635_35715 [Asanoa sp. WMMD1127]|uniref:hypothetical protein n=1 Tax=Asanoa sp. WMMD1127 TaxID=3016107 RepID=UPI002416D5F1|nr:hypothetical protein [Asanoa sp. WMMD1127]MDG4827224.1 hypothetical protein [Asanoa sp. WMMD1127]
MSKTVAVIRDDDRWFWAFDVSLVMLAVELLGLLDDADLESRLLGPVQVPGTLGLHLVGLTEPQRERLVAALAEASRRLRARPAIPADEAIGEARRYVADVGPDLLRGAPHIDTEPVAAVADAVVALLRDALPPPPPGRTAWLYGWEDGPLP